MNTRFVSAWLLLAGSALATPAVAFELLGIKWPVPEATLYVDLRYLDGSSPSGTTWNDAYGQAANSWSDSTAFSFNILNTRSNPCAGVRPGIPEDGFRNGVGFSVDVCGFEFGFDTLAVTLTYGDTEITESDVVFNISEPWDVYSGPSAPIVPDFRRVAAHELGHVLGLDHENDVPALMSTFLSPQSVIEAPLADDLNGVASLYGGTGIDPTLPPIVLTLEEPAPNALKTGVANLRGWTVALADLDRVELLVDGVFHSDLPLGGLRSDVGQAFPEYPGSQNSGYSIAFNYNNLQPGFHNFQVRAFDKIGNSLTASAGFNVIRFDNPFIQDPASLSLSSASAFTEGESIRVNHVFADGRFYDLTLQWNTATQTYTTVSIQPSP